MLQYFSVSCDRVYSTHTSVLWVNLLCLLVLLISSSMVVVVTHLNRHFIYQLLYAAFSHCCS